MWPVKISRATFQMNFVSHAFVAPESPWRCPCRKLFNCVSQKPCSHMYRPVLRAARTRTTTNLTLAFLRDFHTIHWEYSSNKIQPINMQHNPIEFSMIFDNLPSVFSKLLKPCLNVLALKNVVTAKKNSRWPRWNLSKYEIVWRWKRVVRHERHLGVWTRRFVHASRFGVDGNELGGCTQS